MEQTPDKSPPSEPTPDISFTTLHRPLVHMLPPALRHRPKGVDGSLKALETFFGADVSHEMVDVAARLSERQTAELEGLLWHEGQNTNEAVSIVERPNEHLRLERFHRLKSIFMSPMNRRLRELLHTRPEDDFFWRQRHIVTVDEIGTHEDLLPSGSPAQHTSQDIGDIAALKHLALYCQQTAIRDPLQSPWSDSYVMSLPYREQGSFFSLDTRRRRLANGIRQLLPIAPLVRSGAFILVGVDDMLETHPFAHLSGRKQDPFFRWTLSQHRPDLQQEIDNAVQARHVAADDSQARNAALDRLWRAEKEALPVIRQNYPGNLSDEAWQRIIKLSNWTYYYALTPFTSDPFIVRHLEQGSRLVLNGQPDLTDTTKAIASTISPGSMAVSYQVPSLNSTQFEDIARLRDSSLFEELRTAMIALAKTCMDSSPEDYDAYQRQVGESAEDIVGPLYRKVQTRLRLNKWVKLGVMAGSKMDIGGTAGKIIGAGVEKVVGTNVEKRLRTTETMHGILRSLFDYK